MSIRFTETKPKVEFFQTQTFRCSKLAHILSTTFPKVSVNDFSSIKDSLNEHYKDVMKLDLCLIRPICSFLNHHQMFSPSRGPSEFLTPQITERLKASRTTLKPNFLCLRSTREEETASLIKGIVVLRITPHDIMDYHPILMRINKKEKQWTLIHFVSEIPITKKNWQSQLYETFSMVMVCFPKGNYRLFAFLNSEIRRLIANESNGLLEHFIITTLTEYSIDIHWLSNEEEEALQVKRWILAMEKCQNGPSPSTFGTRISHPALSKYSPGVEKNWLNQLIQVPGLEYNTAVAIHERFPTPSSLIDLISRSKDMTQIVENLQSIHVDHPRGKKDISYSVVSRLYELFKQDASPFQWMILPKT